MRNDAPSKDLSSAVPCRPAPAKPGDVRLRGVAFVRDGEGRSHVVHGSSPKLEERANATDGKTLGGGGRCDETAARCHARGREQETHGTAGLRPRRRREERPGIRGGEGAGGGLGAIRGQASEGPLPLGGKDGDDDGKDAGGGDGKRATGLRPPGWTRCRPPKKAAQPCEPPPSESSDADGDAAKGPNGGEEDDGDEEWRDEWVIDDAEGVQAARP
ncbi:hypothetical protein THAOC_20221, partial [Thalassiosira oceanica]